MPQYLWIRIAVVVAVIAASIWYLYPPGKTINLGLDLQGGIHLVLGVEVDKAVEAVVERTAGELRGALEKKASAPRRPGRGRPASWSSSTSPQAFNDAQAVLKDFTNFTIRSSDATAGRIELALTESEVARLRDFAVRQGVETIRNRVDQFGVAEPTIQRQGENRILVQLPGRPGPGPGEGAHRQDRPPRVQAPRRAGRRGESGEGGTAARHRAPLRPAGRPPDQDRDEGPLRGQEADAPDGRPDPERRGLDQRLGEPTSP